ncbi:MAG TPA: alpha/beta hydrolase-fold protein [Thermoanaerobaculia bacterium]|nr:alpha/beta hydrolase-fold protein [Thermoanaerobaculia bacterium]
MRSSFPRSDLEWLASAMVAAFAALSAANASAAESELRPGALVSELVPSPVQYYALLPPGYAEAGEPLPLALDLHGGGGSREVLARQKPIFDRMWSEGELPPMVIVMPSVTARGFYLDRRDGAERWETFLIGPFLEHLRSTYRVRRDRRGTLITGISMGGMGSLRIAFKHPELFGAVAGMEPGIEPILAYSEMRPKHRFWRGEDLMLAAFGHTVDGRAVIDEEHWAANNPATIVLRDAQQLRDSGLKIFIEAGDADLFWLYEGTEFLHRVLWDHKIRHEYRLYYDAEHVGRTLGERTQQALLFLVRSLVDPEPDPQVEQARARIDPLKGRLTEADHYGVDADKVGHGAGAGAESEGGPPR